MTIQKTVNIFAFAFFLICNFTISAQSADSNKQQLRLHIKQNGKIQFVDFAIAKTYFSAATESTELETKKNEGSEFTEKGIGTDGYFTHVYFLIKNKLIQAHSETADFSDQASGIYMLSAYSFPSNISPDAFIGQSFETLEHHPLFQKDKDVRRLIVTLIVPEKEKESVILSEPEAESNSSEIVEASVSGSN